MDRPQLPLIRTSAVTGGAGAGYYRSRGSGAYSRWHRSSSARTPSVILPDSEGHMNLFWKTVLCLYIVVPGPAIVVPGWLLSCPGWLLSCPGRLRPVISRSTISTPELDRGLWCSCQIDMNRAPVEFLRDPDDAGNQYARITVDINSLGGNVCRKAAPDDECGKPVSAFSLSSDRPRALQEPDTLKLLAPGFIDEAKIVPVAAIDMNADPYCDSAIIRKAIAAGEEGRCIQRQELRFQSQYIHAADEPFTYKLRFRMPAVIQDTKNSVRWVTAQWKQEPVSPAYDDPSPVLAQRFDDGVLHVTVQDGDCRCRVASAPMPDGSIWPAKPGLAHDCVSTRPGDPDNTACTPDLTLEYGADPVLPSARGAWVDMQYRVADESVQDRGNRNPCQWPIHREGHRKDRL